MSNDITYQRWALLGQIREIEWQFEFPPLYPVFERDSAMRRNAERRERITALYEEMSQLEATQEEHRHERRRETCQIPGTHTAPL